MALPSPLLQPGIDLFTTPLDGLPFAVVDVETTGLSPTVDRVVEVAIVRLTAHGRVTGQYCTRVQPHWPLGDSQEIHRLGAHDLRTAPTFDQIAGKLAAQLAGAVVVAHNASFDLAFLGAEYRRLEVPFAPLGLCTMRLAVRLGLQPPASPLPACCQAAGVWLSAAHTARGDARATARLLYVYLNLARQRGIDSLGALGCRVYRR